MRADEGLAAKGKSKVILF